MVLADMAGQERMGGRETPNKKGKQMDPWEVEIGKLTKPVDGGEPTVKVIETTATIQAGERGPVMNKSDMAMLCNCGVDDKCWAIPLSMKRWPWKLEMCNHHKEEGHQHYDSVKHQFSKRELEELSELIRTTVADQRSAREK